MALLGRIKNYFKERSSPVPLGENISLTHEEMFYKDKETAHLIKENNLAKIINELASYYQKESIIKDRIEIIKEYLNSKQDEPPQPSHMIKDYKQKIKKTSELVSSLLNIVKEINFESELLKKADVLGGVIASQGIISKMVVIHQEIDLLDKRLKEDKKLADTDYSNFLYEKWKKSILKELSVIGGNITIVSASLTSNINYLKRILISIKTR
ncbi:MAG: hypothetical protein KatS3mg002_0948 [Candidatus Woesearchaeota archaeon]|nr:MAG: hypothetical protein KatS3mg002_0948 [Candidatus Woesearchaeota archaeon]